MKNPAKFVMVEGDDDTLEWTISDVNGVVDLSTATQVLLRYIVGSVTYDVVATIAAPSIGKCRYELTPTDKALLVHGSYRCRSKVTFATGRSKHFPNTGYNTIEVEK